MSFIESPRFPTNVRYGSRSGPTFQTDEIIYAGGARSTNQRWEFPLYEFDAKYSIRSRADIQNIYALFLVSGGKAGGFRVKDEWDYTTNADGITAPMNTDSNLGTGDGSTTFFQLRKSYTVGSVTVYRELKKPIISSVLIAVDGVPKTVGVDYTLDALGGITFTSAPTLGLSITGGCEFDVPCHFNTDDLALLEFIRNDGAQSLGSLPNIPLKELRNPSA